ncbi:MAG: hypothetical protein E6J63_09240 [Deltaproteobacteria bacterium]|nr:MAG: hypothetical protein E6J63_09240 [Deltaproteobacteria bacterium]
MLAYSNTPCWTNPSHTDFLARCVSRPRAGALECARNGGAPVKRMLAVMACAVSGCIYADVKTPLAYRAPTAVEAKAEGAADVEGTACNQAVLGLVAWGDGGYAAAVADAKAKSGATQLADVRADTTFFNILFLYDKACTRVTAKAVR